MAWIVRRKWDGLYLTRQGRGIIGERAHQFHSPVRARKVAVRSLPLSLKLGIGLANAQGRRALFDALFELEEVEGRV